MGPEMQQQQRRTVVVTGASDGIGAATARALARGGHEVVVVGRSPERTNAVADELGAARHVVDYADLAAVAGLADRLAAAHPRLDVLVNNAGLVAGARSTTRDGHELTFQVNHLAPMLLTLRLRGPLAAAHGRVVTTASAAALGRQAVVDLDDLESTRRYRALAVYATTKLENILTTAELARRWAGDGITAAAAHPGMVGSSFGSAGTAPVRLFMAAARRFLRTPEQGADTLVWLATAPAGEWESGGYYADRKRTAAPVDPRLAADLWDRTVQLLAAYVG
jgi:NAD(P)-dependent dehydrogenase (short-subunit alcohol dehydrogenase family)